MPLSKIDSDSLNSGAVTSTALAAGAVANQNLGTPTVLVATNASGTANALNAGIAVNQTWQSVVGSRSAGTTYYNTTGKPIYVSITGSATSAAATFVATLNGSTQVWGSIGSNTLNSDLSVQFIVTPGGDYLLGTRNGSSTVGAWYELR